MTRFTFIRSNPVAGHKLGMPVGCLAYQLDCKSGRFEFEISAHNPKDEFNRAVARSVAEGRMLKHPRVITFDPAHEPPKLGGLLQLAIIQLLSGDYVPNRLYKALKLRLAYIAESFKKDKQALRPKETSESLLLHPETKEAPPLQA